MTGLARSFGLIFVSLVFGMAAQQVVTKLTVASDDMELESMADQVSWTDAAAYYETQRHSDPRWVMPVTYVAVVDQPQSMAAETPVAAVEEVSVAEPIATDQPVPQQVTPTEETLQQPAESAIAVVSEPEETVAVTQVESDVDAVREDETIVVQDEPVTTIAITDQPPVEDVAPKTPVPSSVPVLTPPAVEEMFADIDDVEAMPEDEPVRAELIRNRMEAQRYAAMQQAMAQPSRYVNAQELIRQRAALKAANRMQRIEARKWMGYSPLRPTVTPLPYTSGDQSRPAIIIAPRVVITSP